jgi:ABC-2 type transport system ATP-binding protein
MRAIEVDGLVRRFGDFTAVDGVSFEVEEGEVFGFLGPNGAGKSTTINMLCTLLRPTAGRASVNGLDVATRQHEVRQCLGLIFQDPTLDERLSGMQNLKFHAMLYNVPTDVFRQRSAELLEMVDLTDKAKETVREYSGGMKRRLEIARGLLHHPRILFLDEPTIGLDPQTRRMIWDYLHKLRAKEHLTLFLTTHYMDEAENCDRIAFIDHGQIIAVDTPENLKAMVGGDIVTMHTSDNESAGAILAAGHAIATRIGPDGELIVEAARGDRLIPGMLSSFAAADKPVTVTSVNLKRPTLEDVFIKLTGRAIREEGANARDSMRRGIRAHGGHARRN